MPTTVWLNGEFVEPQLAQVSAFDAGLQHAVGLFETMHARGGRVLHLWRHLARIQHSARELGLSADLRINPLAEIIRRAVERAQLPDARVRLTITGGDTNLLLAAGAGRASSPSSSSSEPLPLVGGARGGSSPSSSEPLPPAGGARGGSSPPQPQATVLLVVQPATQYPEAMFERGVIAAIAEPRLNPLDPLLGHKTINYWMRLRELQIAAQRGGGEALFLTLSNHLAGAAVSNLFIVRNGALLTPIARGEEPADERGVLRSPVLPGVTRSAVFDYAKSLNIETTVRMLAISDLLDADEAFLTNSSWGVLPLTQVEAKPIADAKPGDITRRLRAMWLDALANPDEN